MSRTCSIVVSVALLLCACAEQSDKQLTREIWADTFVLPSKELDGWVDVDYRFPIPIQPMREAKALLSASMSGISTVMQPPGSTGPLQR